MELARVSPKRNRHRQLEAEALPILVQAAEPERKAVRDQASVLLQATYLRAAVHRQEEERIAGTAGCQEAEYNQLAPGRLVCQAQKFL